MKDALALALLHFIWQGTVLALAGALLMRLMQTPSVRYAIGAATMVALLLAPILTATAIARTGTERAWMAVSKKDASASLTDTPAIVQRESIAAIADASAPATGVVIPTRWILSIWTFGVMVLSLRFIGGWAVARGLTRQTLTPVGDELQAIASQMAARLRVRAAVRVCESASMAVPVMLGCLRPVIILPSAAVTSLPLAQLEALLAHELAHIRRHDYLVNLLQTCVETLCFYHPAVWWISREVRRHREQCCDDVVIEVCDPLTYVTALASVASIATPQLALSATGGSLRDRVRRLIEPSTTSSSTKGVWIAMLPILLVVALVTPQAWGEQATTSAVAGVSVPVEGAASPAPVLEVKPEPQVRESAVAQEVRRAQEQGTVSERRAAELERMRREIENRLAQRKIEGIALERNAEVAREVQQAIESRAVSQNRELERAAVRNAEESRSFERMKEQIAARVEGEVLADRQQSTRSRNEVIALEGQLRDLEQALARQKQLTEKGLTTRESAERFENEIAQLKEVLERSRTMNALIEQLGAESERRVTGRELRDYRGNPGVTLDDSAPLQPDDQLTIAIEGEPDLPSVFSVRSDGSIRFPFLGSIRVQGSTTSQVQAVVRKLLTARGLAPNAAVTVSAQRRR